MQFTPTAIPDVIHIEPLMHGDARGYFMETWRENVRRTIPEQVAEKAAPKVSTTMKAPGTATP